MHVSNGTVTANTRHFPAARVRIDLFDDRLVTIATASLCDLPVALLDLNRLVKIAERKSEGVMVAVGRFGEVFAHEIGRGMTIVASGD